MKKSILFIISSILAIGCGQQVSYTDYVDTSIGTGGHGHVFVGASVPFGMVQLGPTSIPQDWDWCSGYHESDSTVIGFSHTHLSGTGIGDLFDVTVMPVIGEATYARGGEDDPLSGLWSYADRSKEISVPGYYSVPLQRYGITAEMTASSRVGLHRYTFPASSKAAIVIDLENGGCWDRPMDTHIEACGDNAVRGYRHSRGWANNQKVFFYAEFSKPFQNLEVIQKEKKIWENEYKTMNIYARANFQTQEGEQVMMKVEYVAETQPLQTTLQNFIKHKSSVAVVIDEFGGTAGIISIEDALEQIFGEIEDEHDVQESVEKQVGEGEYVLSCRLDVDYLNERYDFGIEESEEYDTLAGYIIYNYEGIPSAGTSFSTDKLDIKILRAAHTRVDLARVKLR